MKAKFLCPILAGIALMGCVKEEMLNHNTKVEQKIAFESPLLYDNVESKAPIPGEINSTIYPTAEKFIIYAAQHSGDFVSWPTDRTNLPVGSNEDGLIHFNGTILSRNSSFDSWVPTYVDGDGEIKYYYWPLNKKLSFSAMSPAGLVCEDITYGPTGLNITGYEVPENPTQHYDVLFAKRLTNQTANNMVNVAGSYSGIQLQFQHALSSIHFSICNTSSNVLKLREIALRNVYGSGNFTEGIESDATVYDRNGNNPTVTPAWTPTGNTSATEYDSFIGDLEFPINPRYVTAVFDEQTAKDPGHHSAPLLIIPQQINDDAALYVKYTVDGQEQEKLFTLKGLMTLATDGIDDSVNKGEAINEWKVGHKYTYRLHYSAESASKNIIMFAPSVTDWTNVQVIQLEL